MLASFVACTGTDVGNPVVDLDATLYQRTSGDLRFRAGWLSLSMVGSFLSRRRSVASSQDSSKIPKLATNHSCRKCSVANVQFRSFSIMTTSWTEFTQMSNP